MSLKIMMSVAEVSADLHASFLARELQGVELFGMGGENMRVAGVDVRMDITAKSSIGIIEALRHIPSHLITLHKLKAMLAKERPDALILVDAQGLNMPLAKYAKKLGIITIYYIAPQEWLWGKHKNLVSVARTLDLIISTFEKEHEIYKAAGGNTCYFGHPLLDIAKPRLSRDEFCKMFGLDPKEKIISLCPGSRQHEIKNLLPILIDDSIKLKNSQLIMPIASPKFAPSIKNIVGKAPVCIKVIEGFNYDCLAHSDLVIAKSGTIVLESLILDAPVIMFYKLSRLTYYIGRHLLGIKLKYYSMPNILAGKEIVPEFVMEKATPENIYGAAERALSDPEGFKKGYPEVIKLLGESGAVRRSAQKIIEFISSR